MLEFDVRRHAHSDVSASRTGQFDRDTVDSLSQNPLQSSFRSIIPALLIPLLLAAWSLTSCTSTRTDPQTGQPAANASPLAIPFTIASPAGAGPFPAIVILHDCSGLGPQSSGAPARWTMEMVGQGYVVVVPDSFSTRGFADGVCTNPAPARADVAPLRRVRDANAALAYLRTLPNVDGTRIGIMGGSHGGATTLATMVAPPAAAANGGTGTGKKRSGFAAAVALYPNCSMRLGNLHADGSGVYQPLAPVLILVGELDDWTPAEPCRKITETAQQAGYPVSIKIYPGAHHSFDSSRPVRHVATRVNANVPGGRGATTGGNAPAWADSLREVSAFFDMHLRKTDGK